MNATLKLREVNLGSNLKLQESQRIHYLSLKLNDGNIKVIVIFLANFQFTVYLTQYSFVYFMY